MAYNSIVDFKSMSKGGLLLDASGDIAFTDNSFEALKAMVVTRVQAALNAYKLYPMIGADLDNVLGTTVAEEAETTIQKQITQALTNQFLTTGSFSVNTIPLSNSIVVYIYLQGTLVMTTTVTT